MSGHVRFEYTLGTSEEDTSTPTFGDLRRWVEHVATQGVDDADVLGIERDDRDEVVGFFVYGRMPA